METPQPKPRWYDLDSLVPYHMLVGAAGFCALVVGVWGYSWKLGCIVAGAGLMGFAWICAKGAE